jgi:hypothetical protein
MRASCGKVPLLYLRSKRERPSALTVAAIFAATVSGEPTYSPPSGPAACSNCPRPNLIGQYSFFDDVPQRLCLRQGPAICGDRDVATRVDTQLNRVRHVPLCFVRPVGSRRPNADIIDRPGTARHNVACSAAPFSPQSSGWRCGRQPIVWSGTRGNPRRSHPPTMQARKIPAEALVVRNISGTRGITPASPSRNRSGGRNSITR